MRSLKHTLCSISFVLISLFACVKLSYADVLIWATDNRSGQPVAADQSEWARYLKAQMSESNNGLVTPSEAGVVGDYPLHLNAQPDMGALMTSRLSTGSDAALWIQLTNSGLQWVLEQDGQSQQLRTPATSDGLGLGVNWIGMQLSMASTATAAPENTAANTLIPSSSLASDASNSSLSSNLTSAVVTTGNSVVAQQPIVYQHPGRVQLITGVMDSSDFLKMTRAIRALAGVEFVYPARIEASDVELVIGSGLADTDLQNLLLQQPWLRRTDQGDLRWDALALPLLRSSSSVSQIQAGTQNASTDASQQGQ